MGTGVTRADSRLAAQAGLTRSSPRRCGTSFSCIGLMPRARTRSSFRPCAVSFRHTSTTPSERISRDWSIVCSARPGSRRSWTKSQGSSDGCTRRWAPSACRCPRLGTRTASLGETLLVTETGPMFAARRGPGAFLLPANHTVLIVGGHGRRAAGRHGRAVRSLALAVPADRLRRWRFTEGRPALRSPRTGCSCWPVRPTPARARSFTASRRSRRTGTITRRGRRSSSRARAGSPVRW